MTPGYFAAVICAFLIALGVPVFLRPILTKAGVVDVPNERSSHTAAVLRGGGLAQAIGMSMGLVFAGLVSSEPDRDLMWVVLGVILASSALGLIEDVKGIAIAIRASLQTLIGLIAALVGAIVINEPLWWALPGGVALLGLINVVNFMDGINAISSLHGVVFGLSFVTIGNLHDAEWLTVSGAVLAAVFLAFLPWNISGRIFLGDVGSYLLGGSIAILVLLGWMKGLPIISLAAPLTVYVVDTGVTLVERVHRGEKWHEAHREHTYQLLTQSGYSHLTVATFVAALSAASAALGILASEQDGAMQTALVCVIPCIGFVYLIIRNNTPNVRAPCRQHHG